RPHVLNFDKTYNFPAYTRLASRQVSEESGDLAGLQGTEVQLELHVDQLVKEGELIFQFAKGAARVKLAPIGTNRLAAKVVLSAAGTYQVRLVAAETAFENKFSPQFEVRPTPDLVPSVELLQPPKDRLAPPDEMLLVQGR